MGGVCRLRIEDIDPQRSRPAFIEGIIVDLAWLGLTYPEPVRHQSRHVAAYRIALDRLIDRGLAYPCFCTRGQIRAQAGSGGTTPCDPDGTPLYPGTCRDLDPTAVADRIARGDPHTWRLDMRSALGSRRASLSYTAFDDAGERRVVADPARWGDVVIARRDVPTSYHLAVVHDDAVEGITHVVRGRDLEAATDLHVLLQALLDLPVPRYRHHPLLRDAAGEKLAKSRGSETLADLRQAGLTPHAIRTRLGFA
ncbi:MAG: tRNA glutamyl-Q(34) synthetase GluQRS, partial [Parafilimonas terrae]|nr:tRNA glutamyl-Q(34) synthetase GluQRS [Parafilimonas terrae]